MKLTEILALEALRDARVVAGRRRLESDVRWAHVVENPDPLPWVREGQLLLTPEQTEAARRRAEDEAERLRRELERYRA